MGSDRSFRRPPSDCCRQEQHGTVPAALRVLSGSERVDVFRADYRPRTHNEAIRQHVTQGPIRRIARSVLNEAMDAGAESVVIQAQLSVVGGWLLPDWPCSPAAGSARGRRVTSPGPVEPREPGDAGSQGEAAPSVWEQMLAAAPGQVRAMVSHRLAEEWRGVLELPGYVFPALCRYFLFAAGVPYWTQAPSSGQAFLEDGKGARPIVIRYEPGARRTSLFVDLRS